MIDNQMKRQDLMRAAEISSSVATKLNKNEIVYLRGRQYKNNGSVLHQIFKDTWVFCNQ